ncbi:MAG: Uma2 family endonuclease [Planctomycetota bacterium]
MVQPATAEPPAAEEPALIPWRISSERYIKMIADGVIGPGDKIELVNGIIVEMSPADPEHHYIITRLVRSLLPPPESAEPLIQGTVRISEGQVFDPDYVLLRPGIDFRTRHPGPEDLLLVVESAKSSLAKDRGPKLRAYAAAGVPDYWIADVQRGVLITHREPRGDSYRIVEERRGDDRVSPLRLPQLSLRVGDLFE